MGKKNTLVRLIEKEKLLYVEVEQLRMHLYLHDTSLIHEFISAFYYAFLDVKKLFIHTQEQKVSVIETKKRSIELLHKKKNSLLFLSKTPYAWLVQSIRKIKTLQSAKKNRVAPRQNRSYIVFGTTECTDFQSRSVQIARKLAQKYTVIYIEGVFDEGNTPGFRIREESPRFTAIRLTALKSLHLNYQKPSSQELSFLKQSLKLSALNFRLSAYLHHPFWHLLLNPKKNTFYFDHAEDFSYFRHGAKHIIAAEKKLLKTARIVSAPQKKLLRNTQDIVIQNGVEWELFKNTSKMIQTCDVGLCWIKKPVIGYIGTLDERIDEELLGKIARAFPASSLVLVGNTDYRPIIEVAEQHSNIFPVGKQPYKKLPLFLQSFDILIAPYKYYKTALQIHPELPLYLASGKPIIASATLTYEVRLGPSQQYKKCLYLPKSHTEWIIAIADALKEKKRSVKKQLRVAAAKKLEWRVNV